MNDTSTDERNASVYNDPQVIQQEIRKARLLADAQQQEQAGLAALTQPETAKLAALKEGLAREIALLEDQERQRRELYNDKFVAAVYELRIECVNRGIDPVDLIKDMIEVLINQSPLKSNE